MLPFKTSITIFIVEFLCSVMLQAFYAVSKYGIERAFLVGLGLLPVLLVFLLSYSISNEGVVVRCLAVAGISSIYYMSYATHTQGMLVFMLLATATTIALFLMLRVLLEYFVITFAILILMGIFQPDVITVFFEMSQYVTYITMYAFAGVAMIFITYSVEKYKREMEEKNELAQEALEAKGNFLANMSHEIRTPMNAIYGMAELLEKQDFAPEEKEYVAVIKRSSENLLSIINEILDFSKVDSGRIEISEEPYDMNELLQDVVTIIEIRMQDKHIRLQLEIDPNLPRGLIGDETRVRQILINLLNNAVKFTNEGSVTLEIHWEDESAIYNMDCGRLTIAVRDTGIGISQENIRKLFTAFGQIDTRKNRNVEGTGLGLAICKGITDAMGGEITVSSEEGYGSVFTVVLRQKIHDATPCNFTADRMEDPHPKKAFAPDFAAPKARVLIVDDNTVNRQVAQQLMKLFAVDAEAVSSGPEAIELIRDKKERYDLIFMDHMMPFMDGVEATGVIRDLPEDYARYVPIVAISANAIQGVEQQFLDAGMNDYISKPIRVEQLAIILKRWLPRKRILSTDGIDVTAGIRNCAGDISSYYELLRTYAHSDLSGELQRYFDEEDLPNYTVCAHSIKGASRSVGALQLADRAQELEEAGKRGDISFIWDHHDDVLSEYQSLIEHLSEDIAINDEN
ncbi:MAG: response regulator [Lachnospiraceae bacterium]|nr:response regulator [Lachnospiraceae bacterium]